MSKTIITISMIIWQNNDDISYNDEVVDKKMMSMIVMYIGKRNNYVK